MDKHTNLQIYNHNPENIFKYLHEKYGFKPYYNELEEKSITNDNKSKSRSRTISPPQINKKFKQKRFDEDNNNDNDNDNKNNNNEDDDEDDDDTTKEEMLLKKLE